MRVRRTQLNYLGHVINSIVRMTDPAKVKAVTELAAPKCVMELETFLGKVGYYQTFIKDYSDLTKPLNALRGKFTEWIWSPVCQRAFEQLKNLLANSPVLRHPEFDLPFILQTDASGYGLGAVLSQEFEDGEHPIAYASRLLLPRETRHATIEKEALGVCWAVQHFRHYVIGRPFLFRLTTNL